METVHVQLPYKRRVVVVFEELGYQGPREFIFVQHDERVAVVGPSYEVFVLVVIEETATSVLI
jgi:hypothetical protein